MAPGLGFALELLLPSSSRASGWKSGWESWLYHVLDCFLVWFIVPAARLGVLCPRRCSNEEVLPLQDLCRCSQSSPQPMCPVLGRDFRQRTAHGRAPLKPAEPTQGTLPHQHHPVPNSPQPAWSLDRSRGQKNTPASQHRSAEINRVTERRNNAVCFRARLHLDSNFPSAAHLRQRLRSTKRP